MEADKTINKWFDETQTLMEERFKARKPIDMLCAGVLKVGKNYCDAVLLLIKSNHKMPAKALLRILCELTAKIVWCLWVPDANGEKADDKVYEKMQRWRKATLIENRKMLESLREAMPVQGKSHLKEDIDNLNTEIEKIKTNENMPGTTVKIFEKLPQNWKDEIYPVYYKQFNNTVHLDPKSIGDLIEETGNKIICHNDSDDRAEDLIAYCIDWAYHINYFIRNNYGWNTKKMMDKYKKYCNDVI